MTHQERIEAHLRKHTGTFFCAACLAHEVATAPYIGRSIVWTLQALPGYEMRGTKCVSCLRGKRTIRHVGSHGVVSPAAHIAIFLLSNREIYLCDACLAFATEVSLHEVRRVLAYMASMAEFDRHRGGCTVCSRETEITAALAVDDAAADRVTEVVTGTVQYRGWRIDLLSYRTSAGWRPFVLIKGELGAGIPDAPSMLWNVLPTKAEADHDAHQAAKAWIDKHSGYPTHQREPRRDTVVQGGLPTSAPDRPHGRRPKKVVRW